MTSPVVLCMQNSVISISITRGPSPQLWFLDAKQRLYGFQPSHVVLCIQNQRLLEGNNKSLWVPDITCRFVCAKQRDLHQNDKSIWVPALICVFFFMQSSDFRTRLQVCICPSPHLWFFQAEQRHFDQHPSLYWYQTSPVSVCVQNSVISTRITSLYGFQP